MHGLTPHDLLLTMALGVVVSAALGLSAFYIIELVRSLPLVNVWVANSKKPWACHVCMSGWASGAWHLSLIFGAGASLPWWFTGPGTAAVSLILLYWTDRLVGDAQPDF
jgi:hypothetical protein